MEQRKCSTWWEDIWSLENGGNGIRKFWFKEAVEKQVGLGNDTLFWKNQWVEGDPLCVQYPRLFSLAVSKDVTVADIS